MSFRHRSILEQGLTQKLSSAAFAVLVCIVTSLSFAEDPPSKLQLDFANGLYNREYYPMAAEEYRKFLTEHPNAPGTDEASYRLGESLHILKKNEEALPHFQTVADKFPDSTYWQKSKYRVGEINYLMQKYADASAQLQQLVSKATDKEVRAAALFLLGKIQFDQGQLDAAAQALVSLAQSPDAGAYAAYSYFTLAQIALKKNEPDKALTYYKTTLQMKPSETLLPETTYEIARLEFNARNYKAAAEDYQKVLTNYPKSPYVAFSINGLVNSLFQDSQWEQCVQKANELLDRATPAARPDILYLVANVQRQLKQWDNAIATYDRIVKEYPSWDQLDAALLYRLDSLYKKKDPEKVVDAAGDFFKKFPQSPLGSRVALTAGEVQYEQKKYAEAAKFYDVILASFPKSSEAPDAAYRKAWTLLLQEQWPQASAAFRFFVQQWPQDARVPDSVARSGQAQQRAGNYAEAIKDYLLIKDKYTTDGVAATVLYQLGLCYGETKQYDAMATTLTSFVEKFPNAKSVPEANYWLGWNAYQLKQWQQAVGYLAKALGSPTRANDAKLKLALSYFQLDQPANAAPFVKDLLKGDLAKIIPMEVYQWLAKHHVGAKQHADALAVYEQMLALIDAKASPGWAVAANLGYGQSALALQKHDDALKAFQKVVELAPESAQAIEALIGAAQACIATKKFPEGEAALNKVLTLQPEGKDNARARMLLGDLLMSQSKFAEAAKHFEAVALLFDDPEVTPLAMTNAAKCLESAGQAEAANKMRADMKLKYPNYQTK